MSWLRMDDSFLEHPKIIGLEAGTLRAWLRALCYASRHDTDDGFVPRAVLPFLGVTPIRERALTSPPPGYKVGLLEVVEGGLRIHDWAQYRARGELTRAERRANAAAAGSRGGLVTAAKKRQRVAEEETSGHGNTPTSLHTEQQNHSKPLQTPAAGGCSPVPSRPVPSRKEEIPPPPLPPEAPTLPSAPSPAATGPTKGSDIKDAAARFAAAYARGISSVTGQPYATPRVGLPFLQQLQEYCRDGTRQLKGDEALAWLTRTAAEYVRARPIATYERSYSLEKFFEWLRGGRQPDPSLNGKGDAWGKGKLVPQPAPASGSLWKTVKG